MKKIFFVAISICMVMAACRRTEVLPDGFYIVHRVVNNLDSRVGRQEAVIPFDRAFIKDAPPGAAALVIGTDDWAPLDLEGRPEIMPQSDGTKRLKLNFSPRGAEKLEAVSRKHITEEATIVINGHALSMHKIRDTIKGGRLEITGCDNETCGRVFQRLTKGK
jgi:hypothetical protein